MEYKIYSLTDPATSLVRYIGFTRKSLEDRLKRHIKESKNTSSRSTHKINWIRQLLARGDLPIISLLENTERYQEREIHWISICKDLTNGTVGGDGRTGPLPESAKIKLRKINAGKTVSEITRKKLSDAHRGRSKSPAHIKKLTGLRRTKETRLKMSQARKGKPLSPEVKEQISKSLKGRIFPNQLTNLAIARTFRKIYPVLQYTLEEALLKRFSSSEEAARLTGVKVNLIRATCGHQQKTAGGYIWKYEKEN